MPKSRALAHRAHLLAGHDQGLGALIQEAGESLLVQTR